MQDKTGVAEGGKLAPIWDGPFRIVEVLPRSNLRLRDLPSIYTHPDVHVSRVKPYVAPEKDEEELQDDEYKMARLASKGI